MSIQCLSSFPSIPCRTFRNIQDLSTPRAPGLLLPQSLALLEEPALALLELLPVGSRGRLGQKMTQIMESKTAGTEEHALETFRNKIRNKAYTNQQRHI